MNEHWEAGTSDQAHVLGPVAGGCAQEAEGQDAAQDGLVRPAAVQEQDVRGLQQPLRSREAHLHAWSPGCKAQVETQRLGLQGSQHRANLLSRGAFKQEITLYESVCLPHEELRTPQRHDGEVLPHEELRRPSERQDGE